MDNLLKFTPLSQEKISEIVSVLQKKNPDIGDVKTYILGAIQKTENQKLIADYQASRDKKEFLANNIVIIADFLNQCRLIGRNHESEEISQEIAEEIKKEIAKAKKLEQDKDKEIEKRIAESKKDRAEIIKEITQEIEKGKILEKNQEEETRKRIQLATLKDMLIGSEAIEIIVAYLIEKDKNKGLLKHQIEVVKNTSLKTQSGSKKHGEIFLENNCVHQNFYNILSRDLKANQGDFDKTYLVELFGTTGGDHVQTITIHKKAGDDAPIFDSFDSSPAIVRNGITGAQNSIANGWSPVAISATIKKACEENHLQFKNENFFNNSQPLQQPPYAMCAIFAYETALAIAKMTREEHVKLLRENYKHQSLYGGLTEMAENLDEQGVNQVIVNDKEIDRQLNLPPIFTQFSHFVDAAIKPILDDFSKHTHQKKSGAIENLQERFERYYGKEKSDGTLENSMIWQKMIRHKFGHLFEIIISDDFQKLITNISEQDIALAKERLEFGGDIHFPASNIEDMELKKFETAFNKILPRTNRISSGFIDDNGNYQVAIYAGNNFAAQLAKQLESNFSLQSSDAQNSFRVDSIDLSDFTINSDERLRTISKISLTITPKKAQEITDTILTKQMVFSAHRPEHQFSLPPKAIENPQEAKKLQPTKLTTISTS